jgi:CheY-like chemotaxis protein
MHADSVTILLAEDDDGHASLVQRNLQRAGLADGFLRVHDGQELLDCLNARGEFAQHRLGPEIVVLLDINMPRIDGVEALRQIKGDPHLRTTPVIMLTTTDDPREIDRCYELGCNVYVTKPVDYDGFMEALRRLGFFLQIVKRPRNGRY